MDVQERTRMPIVDAASPDYVRDINGIYQPDKTNMEEAAYFMAQHPLWLQCVLRWSEENFTMRRAQCPVRHYYEVLQDYPELEDEPEFTPLTTEHDGSWARIPSEVKKREVYCLQCNLVFSIHGYGLCPCCNANNYGTPYTLDDVHRVVLDLMNRALTILENGEV